MSQFVEVNTVGLTGPTLDWAVAKVIGHSADWERSSGCLWFESSDHEWLVWSPSTDWAQGGPLLDKYDIALNGGFADEERVFYATLRDGNHGDYGQLALATGPTRLISACRAVVRHKLGDVVLVPAELVWVVA